MTKTTFRLSVKTDLRNDHFTVVAYGTKKHMQELLAQYIAIPQTAAARIIRDRDNAIIESYERDGGPIKAEGRD